MSVVIGAGAAIGVTSVGSGAATGATNVGSEVGGSVSTGAAATTGLFIRALPKARMPNQIGDKKIASRTNSPLLPNFKPMRC